MGTFNLDQTFIREYERAWNIIYQQSTSMLKDTVRNKPQKSEKQAYTFIEPTSGIVDRARQSQSPNIPTQHQRRWSTLHTWTWSEPVEDIDIVQTLGDPTSEYLTNARKAEDRWEDEFILSNIYNSVYSGKDGNQTVNWYDTGECIGINGDGTKTTAGSAFTDTTQTGLTLPKIALMGVMFGNNSVPAGDRHIVVNEDQKWYLLGYARATSRDYVDGVSQLVRGEIINNYLLGFYFHFLPTERFVYDTTDTSCIRCAAYQKDAMLRTVGFEMKTEIGKDPGYNYMVRPHLEVMVGGCRMQGKGVIPFLLDPNPTLSFSN